MSLIISKCRVITCMNNARYTPVITVPLKHPKTGMPMILSFEDGCCAEHKSSKTNDYLKPEDIQRLEFKAAQRGLVLDWDDIGIEFHDKYQANGVLVTSHLTKDKLDDLKNETKLKRAFDKAIRPSVMVM